MSILVVFVTLLKTDAATRNSEYSELMFVETELNRDVRLAPCTANIVPGAFFQ